VKFSVRVKLLRSEVSPYGEVTFGKEGIAVSKTPICDFVRSYAEKNALRFHMPGHKGKPFLGFEPLDITEFDGADSLYEASSIIAESEQIAGTLFGANTFYSTEGSSQCIRAMLHLARLYAGEQQKPLRIAAGRNAHKVFLSAAALLGWDVSWLVSPKNTSYLSCPIEPEELDAFLQENPVAAVYVTSPDYLGNLLDIGALAEVSHRHGALLLVDNAHGAYLKFLPKSQHPIDLGADLCCDSAHKTLPALTGAAYLHISKNAPIFLKENAKNALSLFGSTSPSYLILQSLDRVNAYLADGCRERLQAFSEQVQALKNTLSHHGYILQGSEPLKITIASKAYGYTGDELADILSQKNIFCEFHDPDFLTLMLTPQNTVRDLEILTQVLLSIPRRNAVNAPPPAFYMPETVLSIREAILSAKETVPVREALGRVLSDVNVGCPPAVPIAVSGERLDNNTLNAFCYYQIRSVSVIK